MPSLFELIQVLVLLGIAIYVIIRPAKSPITLLRGPSPSSWLLGESSL